MHEFIHTSALYQRKDSSLHFHSILYVIQTTTTKRVFWCVLFLWQNKKKSLPYLVAYKSIQLPKRQFNAWFRICVARAKKKQTNNNNERRCSFFGGCFGISMNSIDMLHQLLNELSVEWITHLRDINNKRMEETISTGFIQAGNRLTQFDAFAFQWTFQDIRKIGKFWFSSLTICTPAFDVYLYKDNQRNDWWSLTVETKTCCDIKTMHPYQRTKKVFCLQYRSWGHLRSENL